MQPTVAAPTIKLNNRLVPEDIQATNKLIRMVSLVAELRRSGYVCFAAGMNESTLNDDHNMDTSFDQNGVVELVEFGGSILYMVLYTMCGYQSTYMTSSKYWLQVPKEQKYTYIVWGHNSIGLSR